MDTENPYQSPNATSTAFSEDSIQKPAFNRTIFAHCIAISPALLMLALYYSLAIHMHRSLGDWPTSIGTFGFSRSLETHANLAHAYFSLLVLFSIFTWPIAVLICFRIRRFNFLLYFSGVYAASCIVCGIAMSLAPPEFLRWWID